MDIVYDLAMGFQETAFSAEQILNAIHLQSIAAISAWQELAVLTVRGGVIYMGNIPELSSSRPHTPVPAVGGDCQEMQT